MRIRSDAGFVCWSNLQQYRMHADPYGAPIHVQDVAVGGRRTICGIDTSGWDFGIHNDYNNVGCKRCKTILASQ